MTYFNNKISELIESQLPNFLQEEGPKFIKFVEKYYEWMETSKIEVSVSEDLTLDFSQNTYKIKASKVLGDGQTVKHVYAELINAYKLNSGNYVFFIKEYEENNVNVPVTRGFTAGDVVVFTEGNVGYQGTVEVVSYIQNASLSSKSLWNLQDIDRTLDEYIDFFMKEYLEGFPLSYPSPSESTDLDVEEFKKFLVKNSRDFYQSKGTEDSFKYFFRTIFNEEVTLKYPKEDIFKPSDNNFQNRKVLLLRPLVNSIPDITSKRITGSVSNSSAYVEKVSRFKKGGFEVFEIVLNKPSVSGDFKINEIVKDENNNDIGTVYYGAVDVEVLNSNESFKPEQKFYIDRQGSVVEYSNLSNSDKGSVLELVVCEVNSGKITGVENFQSLNSETQNQIILAINDERIKVGSLVQFDNTDCFLDNGPRRSILASVSQILSNNTIVFKIDREGKGYIKLPKIVKIGESQIFADGDIDYDFISSDIGTIKEVKIREQGLGYSSITVEKTQTEWDTEPNSSLVLRFGEIGINTTTNKFKIGNGVTQWKYLSYDYRDWDENVIFGSSYLEVDLNSSGVDDIRVRINSVFDNGGSFLNSNSFISDSKVVQDSKYYQTFSYLIETSVQVKRFKDLLKRLVHPAGMEMFGNILIENEQNVGIQSQDLKNVIPLIIDNLLSAVGIWAAGDSYDMPDGVTVTLTAGATYTESDGTTHAHDSIIGTVKFVSRYDDIVMEDFKNYMIPPPLILDSGSNSGGVLLDGGNSNNNNPLFGLPYTTSWDKVYQIYKNKYESLIAAPEDESEYYKWGNLELDTSVVEMENSDLTYTGSLILNDELNVGDTFSLSTPKPIQKIFLNNLVLTDVYSGFPLSSVYTSGEKVFSPNQTVELDISNQDSNATFEVGGVLEYTAIPVTYSGNITKIENLSNGNVRVSIADYNFEIVFPTGGTVLDDNGNVIGDVVSVTRKEGIISKESGDSDEFCIEIEDYENEPFVLGETVMRTQGTGEVSKISTEVAKIELIQDQLFKVKQIDIQNNDLITTNNSEVKISSGSLKKVLVGV